VINAPVLVFVHGGAFTRGAKSVDGEIYDNVLYWFARQGFVGVNVEYRLAPQARFPAGAEDVAAATQWVAENIARHGGQPQKIVLMGHSAGGSHVASYLLDPNIGIAAHPGVKAAVLISARLRLECRPENPNARNVAAYCGDDDPAVLERCSPITYAQRCRWPVFVGIGEFENRLLDVYGLEFAHSVARSCGRAPRIVQMPGHNHTSMVAHFNTGEEALGREILSFLRPVLG
jgi:acetyl esterase/lipase